MQFATAADGTDFAIKFYASSRAFAREQALHAHPALAEVDVLPPIVVLSDNADGAVRDARGVAMPPFSSPSAVRA